MKRPGPVLFFFLFLGLAAPVPAQQQTPSQVQAPRPEAPPVSVQKIRGNIYQVKGGAGANTGFVVGEKEVLAVDAKMTGESAERMIGEIRKLTSNPIRWMVLTHSDRDHVNGLAGFPRGMTILSQEKTRAHIAGAFQTGPESAYLPNLVFSDRLSLYLEGGPGARRLDLHYFGPAHTDGDAVAHFPEEKVAFIGDLVFFGRDPLIHRSKNGDSGGLARTLKAILALDAEIFVHGHGDPVSKQEIRALMESIEERQVRIRAMVQQGKSLEQVKAAFPNPDPGSRWMSLAEVIYLELTGKK